LDTKKTEVRYNSEWFSKISFADILKIAGKFTVAQITERDDFAKRLKERNDIGLHEVFYPLMQAYDSVELKADVEIGGTDQKFNILAGRDLQKKMGQAPQNVVFVELLVGTDGKVKMSKSVGNYIGITESPSEMFGKVMSIPDEAMPQYFTLCTTIDMPKNENPRETKVILAKEIVKIYHSEEAAQAAAEEFDRVHREGSIPQDIQTKKIDGSYRLDDLLVQVGLAQSKSAARRLIDESAITINNEKQNDPYKMIEHETIPDEGLVIQKGPKNFVKVIK
jgi:tyrosyl-tRNA synthetase